MTTMVSRVDVGRVRVRRVSRTAILGVARRIASSSNPERLILFGSYAYGHPTPESDVDMFVVMDTALREVDQAVAIAQTVEHHFGLDLLVRTPANLERRLALGDPFLREAIDQSEVYERPGGVS